MADGVNTDAALGSVTNLTISTADVSISEMMLVASFMVRRVSTMASYRSAGTPISL